MTDQSLPQPRNPRVIRQVNKVMRVVLRSPLHRLVSKNVLLLRFTGRKSGKHYALPVSYVEDGNVLLMGTESPWYKNLQGGAPVTMRLRGRERTGTADIISDEAGMRQAYQTMLTTYPGYGRFINVSLGTDGQLKPEQVVQARKRGLVVIRVQLDQASAKPVASHAL